MLTHAELNERFVALDRHPVLLRTAFDGWLAWPVVKERLWLLGRHADMPPAGRAASMLGGAARLSSGAAQLLGNLVAGGARAGAREGALLYEPRRIELPDGRTVHPHLGDLGRIEAAGRWLHCHYAWDGQRPLLPPRGVLEDHGLGAVTAAIAAPAARCRRLRAVAATLADAIAPALPEVDRGVLAAATADQLARFRSRYRLTRWLLRRWRVPRVVVLDPDGKVPEVAAAKSLGLPVTEVQHGMFSAKEPDYSWSAAHRSLTTPLPLPDRIVVFGPLWSNQLRDAGYWREDEIVEAQSPVLGHYRDLRHARPARDGTAPLRVLFASQGYVRDAALPLWRAVLERQREAGAEVFHLRIKVHPLEVRAAAEYEALARAFPGQVSVAPADGEAFREMLQADVVAGYTSLMLVEALGLGIPVLALHGGAAREGLCGTFDLPELADAVHAVDRPESCWAALADLADPARLAAAAARTRQAGERIYTFDGPDVESVIAR